MKVIKRNGVEVDFDSNKIFVAISKANLSVPETERLTEHEIRKITNSVVFECESLDHTVSVEEIQDLVEAELIRYGKVAIAKNYISYRYMHNVARDKYKEMMDTIANKMNASAVENQNANVDEYSFGGRIGEASNAVMKQYALEYLISEKTRRNHENNEIYIHDLDRYAAGMSNCLSCPIDDLLEKGFNTRQTDIRPAKSVSTAMQLVAVIFQLQSLQQFGGVSATHLDWSMVPYVRMSFFKHYRDGMKFLKGVEDFTISGEKGKTSIEDANYRANPEVYQYALEMTKREVHQSVEGMYHNLNTLQSRSGNQLNLRLGIR